MSNWPILSSIIFLPLFGSIILLFIKPNSENNIKLSSLWISIGTFILTLLLWFKFDSNIVGYQFIEKKQWFSNFNFYYHIGIDGISLLLIILTTFLTPLCILSSWHNIKNRIKEYMIAFLILETLLIGMFSSIDLLLFYIFFESVLIPMGKKKKAPASGGSAAAVAAATGGRQHTPRWSSGTGTVPMWRGAVAACRLCGANSTTRSSDLSVPFSALAAAAWNCRAVI